MVSLKMPWSSRSVHRCPARVHSPANTDPAHESYLIHSRPKASIGIVGGGIGGVAAALALHRVGIEAVVYERAPQLREVGAGMMLWPNATRVLRGLGLLEDVLARSGSSTHFLVRARSGAVLMNIALGEFKVPAICIRRSDLLAILLSGLPPQSIRLGHTLNKLEQSNHDVTIRFADGLAAKHDVVIGADGIRSRVRSQLFGWSEPVYRGYTVWRGVAPYDGDAILPGSNSETWGVGKRFGILNTGPGKFTWYAAANAPPDHVDAAGGRKRELLEAFSGWHEPVGDLIEATDDNEIMKNGAYDVVPLRRWGEGRVTLLGDAAHACTPNLGQGGGMALEDAAVLAKCFEQGTAPVIALRRYENLRRQRTRHIQQRSRLMGEIGQWESRVVVAGRRVVTSLLPAKIFEHNLRRVYSYEI
jgi:2-polyprenyl-6-methoxyphenol hydroxylase-like FAD-dependent oxidoreductase